MSPIRRAPLPLRLLLRRRSVGAGGAGAGAAAELGHEALALTDHDGVWGAMEFAQACRSFGVRPIVGSEMTIRALVGERFHLTLLVESRRGGGTSAGW